MSWKKFFVGEPMPDKEDPRYRDRYEREVEAGRKFAKASGISWTARRLQQWGQAHKAVFVALVFGFVIICFVVNAVRLFSAYQHRGPQQAIAVGRLDSALQESRHPVGDIGF